MLGFGGDVSSILGYANVDLAVAPTQVATSFHVIDAHTS